MEVLQVLESFETAAEFLGRDPKVLPGVEGLTEAEAKDTIGNFKLGILSQASWKAVEEKLDWDNYDQRKWSAWWDMRKQVSSGVGLSFRDCGYDHASSAVGARRVFPTRDILEFVTEKHFQLFVDTMVIPEEN